METPPLFYPGPYAYNDKAGVVYRLDPSGAIIQQVCDVRGWGHLVGRAGGLSLSDEEAAKRFDATGRLLAAAPTMYKTLLTLWQHNAGVDDPNSRSTAAAAKKALLEAGFKE